MILGHDDADVKSALDGAQDALSRMARACKRGTGCHLTAGQIKSLSLTTIESLWEQDDPRKPPPISIGSTQ